MTCILCSPYRAGLLLMAGAMWLLDAYYARGWAAQTAHHAQAAPSQEQLCHSEFAQLRQTLDDARLQMTVVAADALGATPYVMLRAQNAGHRYVSWEHLNGEIRGYALRDHHGYDYNRDRHLTGELTIHPTRLWDRLFAADLSLKGYSCVLAGRTRVMGRRVSLLKLTPQDGLRFVFVVAKDDETRLPVELAVVDPSKSKLVSKFTVLSTELISAQASLEVDDELFDRYPPPTASATANGRGHLSEFKIPAAFTLEDSGHRLAGDQSGDEYDYELYTDGITSFQVCRARAQSNYFPIASRGTVLVLKKQVKNYEYTVVGEVPLALAEYVLSAL